MTGPDRERARVLSEIEFAMNRVARVINSRRLARTLEERSGLQLGQLTVATLARIRRRGKARLTDVSRDVGYEPSRVSKEVQRLLATGLVEQQRDPADRRAYLLTVTAAGDKAYLEYRRAADQVLADAFADWSDRDLRQAANLFARLADSTSAPVDDVVPWVSPGPTTGRRER